MLDLDHTSLTINLQNEFSAEGVDRAGLVDSWSDDLVLNVASKCPNTIVVIHNAGIRLVDAWIDHPNVTAAIFAHLPGQDSGRALVEIMYGVQSPSGRLPYTVARQASDYGGLLWPVKPDNRSNYYTQSNFTEGTFIDYRDFMKRNVMPRFVFGYGLTYTTFDYTSLGVQVLNSNSTALLLPETSSTLPGGPFALWDVIARVKATVTNTGNVTAAEVAQLYVSIPDTEVPARQLRGFEKVLLKPEESAAVEFELTRRDLSVWDTAWQAWIMPRGTVGIAVGKSVLDVKLLGNFVLH